MSGSGISWAICKSAPRSGQITMPVPHHSVFYRPDALPAAQPTVSKHWRTIFHYCILYQDFCSTDVFFAVTLGLAWYSKRKSLRMTGDNFYDWIALLLLQTSKQWQQTGPLFLDPRSDFQLSQRKGCCSLHADSLTPTLLHHLPINTE